LEDYKFSVDLIIAKLKEQLVEVDSLNQLFKASGTSFDILTEKQRKFGEAIDNILSATPKLKDEINRLNKVLEERIQERGKFLEEDVSEQVINLEKEIDSLKKTIEGLWAIVAENELKKASPEFKKIIKLLKLKKIIKL